MHKISYCPKFALDFWARSHTFPKLTTAMVVMPTRRSLMMNQATANHTAILQKPESWSSRKAGFSLTEVIIGAMILIFILLPAFVTVMHSTRIIDKARDITLGSSVAQSLVEQLRMQTYASICTKYCQTASPTVGETYTYSKSSFATDIANERFTSQNAKNYSVTGSFKCVTAGQLEVELTVEWLDMNQVKQTHKFFTIISEGGLSDNVNKGW